MAARRGRPTGTLDLVSKRPLGRVSSIAVGRAQQSTEWLAQNMDGHLAFAATPDRLGRVSGGEAVPPEAVRDALSRPLSARTKAGVRYGAGSL